MLPLRYPWIWLFVGWLLVAAVIVGSVMPDGPMRGLPVSDKTMHAASYCLLMIWFAGLYARQRHVWIALIMLALGVVLELIQGRLSYRMFAVADLLANALGVLAGFVLSFWLLAGWCQRLERRLIAIR